MEPVYFCPSAACAVYSLTPIERNSNQSSPINGGAVRLFIPIVQRAAVAPPGGLFALALPTTPNLTSAGLSFQYFLLGLVCIIVFLPPAFNFPSNIIAPFHLKIISMQLLNGT